MDWAVLRAPYASNPEKSRGRLHREPEHEMRSPFQRDRDRIIHSTAFRRLMHKTQVFVTHEGDHYRTRLTHSLEVAQIARTIARALGLDEDLAEALALAHDLGHTPFGHAGEEALNAEMAPYGGFSHNDHTLRILTRLEHGYADFDGLNLTWETLEGTVKHNGPLLGPEIERPVPPSIAEYDRRHPRHRSRRCRTTSPTTITISMMGCALACSQCPISTRCRWSGRCSPRSRMRIGSSTSRAWRGNRFAD
jgi:dGTPase